MSKELSKKQRDNTGTSKGLTFYQVRKKLFRHTEAQFLKSDFDTLFLLEKHSIESGGYYGKIWTRRDSVSYFYSYDAFDFTNNNIFTNYTSYLLSKRDTVGIREQEMRYSNTIHQHNIYGSMIIKKGRSYEIQTILFKEFYNLDRDRFGSLYKNKAIALGNLQF